MPQTRKKRLPIRKNGKLFFEDYPDFRPNLTPREMFKAGSFGGMYWRPIYSKVNKKNYKNVHKKYPKSWWKNIPETHLSSPDYDKDINKYKSKWGLLSNSGNRKNGSKVLIHMAGSIGIVTSI